MSDNNLTEFCQEESCFVTQEKVDKLIENALTNPLKKYRYCLHQNPECTLHEMIIVTTKHDLKYPDKHMYTTESNIILRGKLLVILFSEAGDIQKSFILDSEKIFYYRCEKNQYHMTVPLTDIAVYIEIKEGPFDEKSNVFPMWAPDRQDREGMVSFNKRIKEKALNML